jgi:adenylyltransferase/sulfurtransferase
MTKEWFAYCTAPAKPASGEEHPVFNYQEYRDRYSQHVLFYEAGVDNRQKVYDARVAVVGLGSIGIEAARLLTIAQVQLLRFIHWENPAGANRQAGSDQVPSPDCLPRGMVAVHALASASPSCAFEILEATNTDEFQTLLRDVDLVLFSDDGNERRQLISETCRSLNKPWIYAEAHGGAGITVNVIPGRTACIDCVKREFESVQPKDQGFVYTSTVTDLIARTLSQVQAVEALRILGDSPNISSEAFCFDVDKFGHTLQVAKNESCPSCRR